MDYDIDDNFQTLLFNSNVSGIPLIYSVPVDLSQEPKQINSGTDPVMIARIAPKGDKLIYFQDEAGNEIFQLYLLPVEGGTPKKLTDTDQRTFTIDWHPSGKEIARCYVSMIAPGIEIINVETGEASALNEPSPLAVDLSYSPDGKWLAYTSDETGEEEVYVRPYPIEVETGRVQISTNGGDSPLWSPEGRELFYRNEDAVMTVPVQTEPEFKAGKSKLLFHEEYVSPTFGPGDMSPSFWDIHPDGDRFLMMKQPIPRTIIIVRNWFEKLKDQVPAP